MVLLGVVKVVGEELGLNLEANRCRPLNSGSSMLGASQGFMIYGYFSGASREEG